MEPSAVFVRVRWMETQEESWRAKDKLFSYGRWAHDRSENDMSSVAIPKKERIPCSYGKMQSDVGCLTPPALDTLVHDGVLVKLGNWYRVHRPDDFPMNLRFGARV